MFSGDAIFPSEPHWGTRCPMFAGDAVFPDELHWGTDAHAMFAGDAHCGNQFTPILGVISTPHFNSE